MKNIIGKRLKAARQEAGLTQTELSSMLGFNDRQTLSAIESGKRKISADELLQVINALGKDLDYFTDPFRLEGEGKFSWRASTDNTELINEYESKVSRYLALYRNITEQEKVWTAPLRLGLTANDSYEEAHRSAEWLGDEWGLGDTPAARLEDKIRDRLNALVLYIDAPEGISGAASKLDDFSAILINRNEPEGRRNFDLAHELFHLLTWDTIKPDHQEDVTIQWWKASRKEQLANCFASSLLMPECEIRDKWGQAPNRDDSAWHNWISESASGFNVTRTALLWRSFKLGLLEKETVVESAKWTELSEKQNDKPNMFSYDYVNTLKQGIEEGRISVRRAASLLDLSIDEMEEIFNEYSIEVPFDI